MAKKKPFSYDAAVKDLEQLLAQLQAGEVPIDELSKKLSAAQATIQQCQEMLRTVHTQIEMGFSGEEKPIEK